MPFQPKREKICFFRSISNFSPIDIERSSLRQEKYIMNNDQREKIASLRNEGYGYTAIANSVGLSKDSVKAFCRSHGLAGEKAENHALVEIPKEIQNEICPVCGKTLLQTVGHKHRRFCSDKCRVAWWNSHPQMVKQRAVYSFSCPTCGKLFTAYGNSKRKYCSHDCYIKARFKCGAAS